MLTVSGFIVFKTGLNLSLFFYVYLNNRDYSIWMYRVTPSFIMILEVNARDTVVFALHETLECLFCTRHWSICLVRDPGVFILYTKHWSIYLARDTVVYILYETLVFILYEKLEYAKQISRESCITLTHDYIFAIPHYLSHRKIIMI